MALYKTLVIESRVNFHGVQVPLHAGVVGALGVVWPRSIVSVKHRVRRSHDA